MNSIPTPQAQAIMKKGKAPAAEYVHKDCCSNHPQRLNEILDFLLNPNNSIGDWDTVDWCRWLVASGHTPDEFTDIVRQYDNASLCGLVWTANFVAYRCRTCSISPCMSLCLECFQKGNHINHDFNMFRSQAGGACDCGDTNVMKETGFCSRHGPQAQANKPNAPTDLLNVAEVMMPRIFLRLIQYFRDSSVAEVPSTTIQDADLFLTMLLEFSSLGAAMRRVMANTLTNPQLYKNMTTPNGLPCQVVYMRKSKEVYETALDTLLNPDPPEEFKDCVALQKRLVHRCFLEELMFWNIKFEFPQKMVCLLLNLLPEPDYKEALTQALVLHYSRISHMLERSSDPDSMSNRVVHMSVQLFSNQQLAMSMTENLDLLHVMTITLKYMMSQLLIPNTLHEPDKNLHLVVDCGLAVMKEHCYWPLVSDLNNVLSHRSVALKFMGDDSLLEIWFDFLTMFQGMNVNQREMTQHIEFEPNTYYAAFSAELEACAYPMWALLAHLDESTLQYSKRVINSCLTALQDWLDEISFTHPIEKDKYQVSFHLSLHRYLAVFMSNAIRRQGLALRDVLPPSDVVQLIMFHPLRVQAAFYEIVSGLWVRNGLQIKGQAMTYIQCNFCNSMVDADLYLLQVCATQLQPEKFLTTVLDQFHMKDWLSLAAFTNPQHLLDSELETPMLESCLLFLATLVSIRNYLGVSEATISELEMGTLLCMGDKTHSQLIDLMPEKSYPLPQSRDFETVLTEVADYRAPNFESSGNMQQGMYRPKAWIWDQQYNPIHVLLRAVHRRDFQNSMDRFTEYVQQTGKFKGSGSPWPPFRMPKDVHPAYDDPRKVLQSRVFHSFAFIVLHKAVHGHDVSDHVIALTLYLLELALSIESPLEEPSQICPASHRQEPHIVKDGDLMSWYDTDWLSNNLRTVVNSVILNMEQSAYDSSESEGESFSLDCRPGPLALEQSQTQARALALGPKRYRSAPLFLTHPPALNMIAGSSSSQAGAFSLPALPQPGVGDGTMEVESPASPDEVAELVFSGESEASASEGGCLALVSGGRSTEDDDSSGEMEITHSMSLAVVGEMAVISTDGAASDTEVASGMRGMEPVPSSSSRNIVPVGSQAIQPAASSSGSNIVAVGVQAVEPSSSSSGRSKFFKKKHKKTGSENVHVSMSVNESIISLLLKLHSNLTETPDSFNPYDVERKAAQASGSSEETNDYVGDGPFFVGKLLKHIMALDPMCRDAVFEVREKLWGKKPEENKDEQRMREDEEREERRRRAKERQKKLMEEFASQQKQFMEMAMETDENGMDWEEDESASMVSQKEYDCAICNQTTLSTAENPMGLVVLLQPTSVLGHKRSRKEFKLPTTDEEQSVLKIRDKLSDSFDRRVQSMSQQFDDLSWQLSVNLGWEGGVHLQTCGHHLHLECHKSYLQSLKNQQRQQQSLDVDRGEYSCPICRQLANSVLPLTPELGECAAMVRSRPTNPQSIVSEISHLLLENPVVVKASTLPEAMGKLMEDMTNCTHRKYKQKSATTSHQSLFLFVASIARTNLELELVQRGGNLCTDLESINSPLIPKRSCIVPLLHVLAIHARCLAVWPICKMWQQLVGIETEIETTAIAPIEKEVPLLLRDPTAILLQLVLLLPLHIDETFFLCVVKVLYNLLYFQVLAQLSCRLSDRERRVWRAAFDNKQPSLSEVTTLEAAMALTIRLLEPSQIYLDTSDMETGSSQSQPSSSSSQPSESQKSAPSASGVSSAPSTSSLDSPDIPPMIFLHRRSVVRVDDPDSPLEPLSEQEQNILLNKKALENEVQQLCLSFLRIAALLRHHLYEQPLPEIQDENSEFVRLVYYLDLVSEGMNLAKFNSAVVLSWPAADPNNSAYMPPKDWAEELNAFALNAQMTARAFLLDNHKLWSQPKLLSLPQVYDGIFQYYLRRHCSQCDSVPRETTLCLLCGTLVCFKENCCQQSDVCEAVQHAEICGAGTAVFLVVTSSCIIVIRGKRACLWGSVYLDSFGEEDRELKRGRPLFLSPERYQLLQQQWVSHRFDHTNKKWVWHRDSL